MGQQKSATNQALKELRGIVDAGGPSTPVRSLPRPPVMEANTPIRKLKSSVQPISDEPLAQSNPLDAIGGFGTTDFIADPGNIGAGAATAPIGALKKLPIISPEAYNDVKAGGMRLYSRLTDTFAKAPEKMKPEKALSLARSGASKEEIEIRKLSEFLKGRNPMADIPREEIMGHLASNPLELEVARKGHGSPTNIALDDLTKAQEEYNRFIHDLDTRYGQTWTHASNEYPADAGGVLITPEEAAQHIALRDRLNAVRDNLVGSPQNQPEYSWMQTPGPSENYGESLIKMPEGPNTKRINQLQREMEEWSRIYNENPNLDTDDALDYRRSLMEQMDELEHEPVFQSGHFQDDPNTLVWSRHNDRYLQPRPPDDAILPGDENLPANKGRFVEEIQSDWHQQGRDHGYRTSEIEAEYAAEEAKREALNKQMSAYRMHGDGELDRAVEKIGATNPYDEDVPGTGFGNYKEIFDSYEATPQRYQGILNDADQQVLSEYLGLRKQENDSFRHYVMDNPISSMAPNAPFKDTYHELALKQQLLDAANDPSLEWLGVADADTVSRMEGHPTVREGTKNWYDQKHPSALEKLLKPLGGDVGYDTLPGPAITKNNISILNTEMPNYTPHHNDPMGVFQTIPGTKTEQIASAVPRQADMFQLEELKNQIAQPGRTMPGGGMWKANLTPELKELIKTRGFPAMAALLALQSQRNRMNGDQ